MPRKKQDAKDENPSLKQVLDTYSRKWKKSEVATMPEEKADAILKGEFERVRRIRATLNARRHRKSATP